MTTTGSTSLPRHKFPRSAYHFVFEALHLAQGEARKNVDHEEDAHISGQELLESIRQLALEQFGLMSVSVFHQWGIHCTEDFGKLVFELVERGEMRKTDRDSITDFISVYSFEEVFDQRYKIKVGDAFASEF